MHIPVSASTQRLMQRWRRNRSWRATPASAAAWRAVEAQRRANWSTPNWRASPNNSSP